MKETTKWLERIHEIVNQKETSPAITNGNLAEELHISERHLIRKVKLTTGLSPQKYLRRYRLQKAMTFLEKGEYRTVNETAYAVGFKKVSYFISLFEKEYGSKPLKILQENGWR